MVNWYFLLGNSQHVVRSYTWRALVLEISNTEHSKKKKNSKQVGIIYKSIFCLNETSLCTLYYTLVYPYLHYWAGIRGSTHQSNLKLLITLQKGVIAITSRSTFNAYTHRPYFLRLKMLKFENITKLQKRKVMCVQKSPSSWKLQWLVFI